MIYIKWTYAVHKDKYIIKVEENVIRSDFLYIDGEEMPREDGKALVERYDVIPGQVTFFYGYCKRNAEIKKPPLGVMPCWLYAETRIRDLADAITRQLDADLGYEQKCYIGDVKTDTFGTDTVLEQTINFISVDEMTVGKAIPQEVLDEFRCSNCGAPILSRYGACDYCSGWNEVEW